jgi:hypothetical protein
MLSYNIIQANKNEGRLNKSNSMKSTKTTPGIDKSEHKCKQIVDEVFI